MGTLSACLQSCRRLRHTVRLSLSAPKLAGYAARVMAVGDAAIGRTTTVLTEPFNRMRSAAIAEAPAFIGLGHADDRAVPSPVIDRTTIGSFCNRHRAGPPFRQAHGGLKMRDSFTLGDGPYHFFERNSRRAADSRSLFSFAFSSYNSSRRLASDTFSCHTSPSTQRRLGDPALTGQVARLCPLRACAELQ
jgi:hypothetical protein